MRDDHRWHKVAQVRAELGESPVWDEGEGLLSFVDITGGSIHVLSPQGRVDTIHRSTARIGALALTDSGGLIFTENASVVLLDRATGAVSRRSAPVHDAASYRFNDGGCDPRGGFVTGLMDEGPSAGTGALYRYDSELDARVILRGLSLPNGLAWSADGSTLFFVDSVARAIFQAAYPASGELGAVSRFADTPADLGRPDGIALDRAGGLWVCQFNGGCLLYYDRHGALSDRVDLPVPRPTSCCFGGQDLGTLFITTARHGMTPPELARHPDAGDLFAIRPAIGGLTRHRFRE